MFMQMQHGTFGVIAPGMLVSFTATTEKRTSLRIIGLPTAWTFRWAIKWRCVPAYNPSWWRRLFLRERPRPMGGPVGTPTSPLTWESIEPINVMFDIVGEIDWTVPGCVPADASEAA